MTIETIYIEFHKNTTLGRPWGVIGGPRECRVRLFGPLGASLDLTGAPRGLLGALLNPMAKITYNSNVGLSNDDGKANRISIVS